MAIVKPFKGYRYNTDKIDNLGDVMAPPYDALSDEQMQQYYGLSEYNAVRLISPEKNSDDNENNNCYTRSRDFFNKWLDEEILLQDDKKSLYIYEEIITVNGEKYYNRGIIGLLKLTDFSENIIVPCEEPSTNSKNDRYEMIKTTGSNNSLISCMYTDGDKKIVNAITEITEKKADVEFCTDDDSISHKVWVIDDEELINEITEALDDKKLFIVDGHNRYEACLAYKNDMAKKDGYTGKESYNYVMALISDSREDSRVHLPIHRLLDTSKKVNPAYIIAGLQDNFLVEKIIVDRIDDDMADTIRKQITTQKKNPIMAVYFGGDYFYRLTLTNEKYLSELLPKHSETYRNLDLIVLNKLVLEEQFNIDIDNDDRITYTRMIKDGVKSVEEGKSSALFVVNPVKSWQLEDLINTGEKLPRRSVSIFPKPATGVVIHKFTSEV